MHSHFSNGNPVNEHARTQTKKETIFNAYRKLMHQKNSPVRVLLVFIFVVLVTSFIQGQPFPVTITIAVSPPYPPKVNEYTSQPNKIMTTIMNTSSTVQNVYILGMFSGDNGIKVFTDPAYKMPEPLTLQPGIPYQMNRQNIGDVFDANHLVFQNITKNEILYGSGLPEGDYTICLQAFDYQTGQAVSATEPQGCSNTFTVSDIEPPIILQPTCGQELSSSTPQDVNFVWTRPPGSPFNVQFNFKIIEVLPYDRNINDAINSATHPVFFEKTTDLSSYMLGPTDPTLIDGKQYAFLVTASDPANIVTFRNKGMSEVCSFSYGVTRKPSGGGGPIRTLLTGPYSVTVTPAEVCYGTGATAKLEVSNYPATVPIDQWLIAADPCVPYTANNLPGDRIVDIMSNGQFKTGTGNLLSNLAPLTWYQLEGYTGQSYTTQSLLPAGTYWFTWGLKDLTGSTQDWGFVNPVKFTVDAPPSGVSFSMTQTGTCISGYVSLTLTGIPINNSWGWTWYKSGNLWSNAPQGITPYNLTPPYQDPDPIIQNTEYDVKLINGSCWTMLSMAGWINTIPEAYICVNPNIQNTPLPGLQACINPYQKCPNTWLPICPGCDAILELTDVSSGNLYAQPGTTITWEYLDYPFDCLPANGLPPIIPGVPYFTAVYPAGVPPPTNQPPNPPPTSITTNSNWQPIGTATQTYNTNGLDKTRWYRVTVASQADPTNCWKQFYAVVIVIDPPKKPLINPPISHFPPCNFPVGISLNNPPTDYSDLCSNYTYIWDDGATWNTFPVIPYDAPDYGKYFLKVQNQCGIAVSDTLFITPIALPVHIKGPCCVCTGECATFEVVLEDPTKVYSDYDYLWSWAPPILNQPPDNSYSIEICPSSTPTFISLQVKDKVTQCTMTMSQTLIICP